MSYRRASHLAWRKLGDEMVIVHQKTGRLYGLNGSGGFIWHLLDDGSELGALEVRLAEAGSSLDQGSLRGFVAELESEGLVEVADAPPDDDEALALHLDAPAVWATPEIRWRETMQIFGASCAFVGGLNPQCNQVPTE